MLAQLEHLRFLRKAAQEGLITEDEHAQHRQRLLCVENPPIAPEDQSTWQALVAALIEVIECYAAKEQPSPLINGKVSPKKQIVMSPQAARPGAKPVPPGRFAYNKRGHHFNTKEPVPSLDPIEFEMKGLWVQQEGLATATAVPAVKGQDDGRQQRKPTAGAGARNVPTRNGGVRRAVAGADKWHAARMPNRVRPPAPSRARSPAPNRARSPAAIRRAAAYVANAAGLKQHEKAAPKSGCGPVARPAVRLTLHAEVAL